MSEILTELSARQAKILAAIVKLHSETGHPVSSKELVDKGYFDVSGATLRNEMQELEELGLITQPHTSAGRIPTDAGFRYFINQLMHRVKLSMQEQEVLKKEILKLQAVNAEVGRRLTKLLSTHTSQASFAVFPEEVSATGLSNILDNSVLPVEDAREIAEFFDNLDEYAEEMLTTYQSDQPTAFIGKELKLSTHSDHSMIVTSLQLPSGKRGVIGLIGPKGMQYNKNISLMEYISKLMSGGAAVIALTILTR